MTATATASGPKPSANTPSASGEESEHWLAGKPHENFIATFVVNFIVNFVEFPPRPGGATENSPTIHRWVQGCLGSSPVGTPEPLSLTPCFSWVLARPIRASTVSTVSAPSPVSQRDYIIQPRVGAPRLPWETHPEHP